MAVHWVPRGDIRVLELIWVCLEILRVALGTHDVPSLQRFLPGDFDLPTTTSVHWDFLDAPLHPRRT